MSFLFVDKIQQLVPRKWVQGIKQITPYDTYLIADKYGKLQFVPSFIGETLGQLAAWNVMFSHEFSLRPVAGIVSQVILERPAYLGETLELEAFIDHLDETAVEYHGIARVSGHCVLKIQGALGPLLPMDDFIEQAEVRRQFFQVLTHENSEKIVHSPNKNDKKELALEIEGTFISSQDGFSSTSDILPEAQNEPKEREGREQLLLSSLFSFDRILFSEPGVSLVAEKYISSSPPYFRDHFPKKPVLPMTVLLECKLNLAKEFLTHLALQDHFKVTELRKIKMNEFVYPGDVLQTQIRVKEKEESQLTLSYRSEVAGKRVCVLEIIMKR